MSKLALTGLRPEIVMPESLPTSGGSYIRTDSGELVRTGQHPDPTPEPTPFPTTLTEEDENHG